MRGSNVSAILNVVTAKSSIDTFRLVDEVNGNVAEAARQIDIPAQLC